MDMLLVASSLQNKGCERNYLKNSAVGGTGKQRERNWVLNPDLYDPPSSESRLTHLVRYMYVSWANSIIEC